MKFDLSQIEFSKKDIVKGIKIPSKLTEDLAEDIGIHVGDGSLYRCGSCKTFEMSCSQHINDFEYFQYIKSLKNRLYNVQKFRSYRKGNEINFRYNSLAIATFYSKIIGLPIGKKKNIDVPNIIKNCNDKKIVAAFLRGLIDTDFGLIVRKKYGKYYPTIEGSSASKYLIVSLHKLFERFKIEAGLELDKYRFHNKANKYYKINKIIIRKNNSIIKCLKAIHPNNGKYINKIKKMGLWRFEF